MTASAPAIDIHGQPVAPVGHVLRRTPSLIILDGTAIVADGLAESADVGQDVALYLFDGAIGEGMRQNTALASVEVPVAGVVGVGSGVDEGIVELGLPDVGAEAVDLLEGGV